MSIPTEPRLNGPPTANGDLINRVQQLRLTDVPAAGRKGGGAWLPWILCGLLALSWAGVGVRWYKATEATGGPAAAGTTPAAPGQPGAAAAPGEILLQLKGNLIPVTQVPVSPEDVSGEVVFIGFTEGQRVEKGKTVLAKLRENRYRNEWVMAERGRLAAKYRLAVLTQQTGKEDEKERAARLAKAEANRVKAKAELDRQLDLFANGDGSEKDLDAARNAHDVAVAVFELERSARVAKAEANRVKAKLELDRQNGLMARGTGSQQDLEAAQNAHDTAVAELAMEKATHLAARADLEVAEAKEAEAARLLRNCTIKAPIDGTVLTKKADVGSLVSPMSFNVAASLCEIADLSKLEVEVDVPERQITRIKPGLECQVVADADPTREYRGRVDRVMPIADDTKNVVKIRVQVFLPPGEEPGSFLKPKMAAVVTVINRDVKAGK
jgi:multidrug resistance efflux pump